MLQRLRRHLPRLARIMLGVVGSVWLTAAAAPCVMAAPCLQPAEPPCHESSTAPSGHGPNCPASGGIDCQLPASYCPASFDLADYLLVLPAVAVPTPAALPVDIHASSWMPTPHPGGIPAPPLYLRHLALLL